MSEIRRRFSAHLAQTSDSPIGLEIARAEGCWLYASDPFSLFYGRKTSRLASVFPPVLLFRNIRPLVFPVSFLSLFPALS